MTADERLELDVVFQAEADRRRTTTDLTPKRFDLLQLASTTDARGNQGIPAWVYRNLKPGAKRACNWLIGQGLIEYSWRDCAYVPTQQGRAVYEDALNNEGA